jgi:putative peptidoglycan lipid II flippase
LTLLLATPCLAAFLTMPELLVSALFGRGAFDQQAAALAGQVLFAYALGLIPILLIRTVVASFFARGDTTTPVIASLSALALNVMLKLALFGPLGAPGLALATAIGAWVNFGTLYAIALRRGWTRPNDVLVKTAIAAFSGAIAFELCVLVALEPLARLLADLPRERSLALAFLVGSGAGFGYIVGVLAAAKLVKLDFAHLLKPRLT